MKVLFYDLADRKPTWETSINPYKIAEHNYKIIDRFSNNWNYVFQSGHGLSVLDKKCITMRYKEYKSKDYIANTLGISITKVNDIIESHIRNIQSYKALALLGCDYPIKLSEIMKRYEYTGYYDNYGHWNEPIFKADNLDISIVAFNMFENKYFQNVVKNNDIKTIGELIAWLDKNAMVIKDHKAGIGKAMSKLLLKNAYVVRLCNPETTEILCNI